MELWFSKLAKDETIILGSLLQVLRGRARFYQLEKSVGNKLKTTAFLTEIGPSILLHDGGSETTNQIASSITYFTTFFELSGTIIERR